MSVDLGKLDIKGRKLPYWLSDSGMFTARVAEGETIEASSLKALREALNRHIGKAPLNVPFIEVDIDSAVDNEEPELTVRRGKIMSFHAANGNPMIQYEDMDRTEQSRRWRHEFLKADTDLETLGRLIAAKRKADTELRDFQDAAKIDFNELKEKS